MSTLQIDGKSAKRRDLILKGNILSSVITVCGPMAIFQLIQQFFRVFDLAITAHIGADSVTAVSFFSQLSNVFTVIGGGFAMGAGIVIAGYYGAGNFVKVKQSVNTSFALGVMAAFVLSVGLIVFAPFVLRIANTPMELIEIGLKYYQCEMIGIVPVFFNSIYIAIEKARGNGGVILRLNLVLASVKLSLSAIFVFALNGDVVMISLATLCANCFVAVIGICRLSKRNQVFSLSPSCVKFNWKAIKPLINISAPVMAEKVAFSAGKVMVNAIGVSYGIQIIGALGVSNSISSLTTMPPSSIGDGGAAIIRQNIGGHNKNRALIAFRCIFLINIILGFIGVVATFIMINPLVSWFSSGDIEFASVVKQIFTLEMTSNIFLAINSSVMGFLYGFGYTKLSFMLNFSRLFVFRLPLLIFLQQYTELTGASVMGLVMMTSNALTGVFSIIVVLRLIYIEFGSNGFKLLFTKSKGDFNETI